MKSYEIISFAFGNLCFILGFVPSEGSFVLFYLFPCLMIRMLDTSYYGRFARIFTIVICLISFVFLL
jgi:hypothetical protein